MIDKSCLSIGLIILIRLSVFGQTITTPDSYQSFKWSFDRLKESDTTELTIRYTIKSPASSKFEVLDPQAKLNFNSTYPRGYNDGAVWKGKGWNGEVHFGISGTVGLVSYTFQPVAFFAQNQSYELAPGQAAANTYNYQFNAGNIDWVQRYGDDAYYRFHTGQSEIKLSYGGFQLAAGTQNYMIGPASHFPVMLSNNAAGIPKLNLGTDGPVLLHFREFKIGKVEANLVYGFMNESDYFDADSENDQRYFNALFIAYNPSFAPNLVLGFNKVMYKQAQYFNTRDLFATVRNPREPVKVVNGDTISSGNDFFDQMASVTMEWKFPEVGFRVYGEYALNDFNGSSIRVLMEPEHSRAYTLGFEKLFENEQTDFLLSYEHTNLSRNHTYIYRPEPTFYQHHVNVQGYTNNGQVMGSAVGPGGNGDFLELKAHLKEPGMLFGLNVQRIEYNKDYFVTHSPGINRHDVEYTVGLNGYKSFPSVTLGIETTYSYNYNRYYETGNNKQNVYVGFSAQAKINR